MNPSAHPSTARAPSVFILTSTIDALSTLTRAFSADVFRSVRGVALEAGGVDQPVGGDADVLVIDLDLADAAFGPAAERIVGEHFSRSVRIVRAGAMKPDGARRLMRIDAAEVVDSDATFDALASAVLAAAQKAVARPAASAMAFFSPRGGAGVSTLAVEAAFLLAEAAGGAPDSVCLFDLNLNFGAAASMLNVEAALRLGGATIDASRIDTQLLTAFVSPHASGISVVAAPPGIEAAGAAEAPALMRLLDVATARFGAIVLDLPKDLSQTVRTSFAGADTIFLVLDLTVPGLRLGQVAHEAILASAGAGAKIRVILNRVPRQAGALGPRDVERLLPGLPISLVHTDDETMREALERGLPVNKLRPESRVAREIRDALGMQRRGEREVAIGGIVKRMMGR